MEAEKYLKILGRMCDSFESCERCPNYRVVCAVDSKKQVDTKKAIKVIEEWERQHSATVIPVDLCEKHFDNSVSVEFANICKECTKEFWEEEVK